MEEGTTTAVRRWEDMDKNVLVKIFQKFNILELTSGIGLVCCSWRSACCDPLLWETLDLSILKSTSFYIPFQPYVYVDGPSDQNLIRALIRCLSLSQGNIRTLIFSVTSYVSDDLLSYTAERSPKLRRLVLPAWNRKNLSGICVALRSWKDLESMTMPCFANPRFIMEEISQNCRNFRELKVMGPFNIDFASALSTYLPQLKVLSLRCSKLYKESLILILDGLPNLEVLKISHCVLLETPPPPEPERRVMTKLDEYILEKASRLREFHICVDDSCITCQCTKDNEGLERWWYGYEENI